MHPILARFGPIVVYSYGAMVALGFGLAILLIFQNAPRFNLDKNKMLDMSILALLGGIIGGRALFVALNINYYLSRPMEIFELSRGGLVWYGGFLLGFTAVMLYITRHRLKAWDILDLIAPYLALAQSVGRIGCYLNGCCYGTKVSDLYPFGVIFPNTTTFRHPVQLYSSLALLAIFVILSIWQEWRRFGGEIFLGYCILYSVKRFILEFYRGDNPKVAFDLTLSQNISVVLFFVSAIIFLYKALKWKKTL